MQKPKPVTVIVFAIAGNLAIAVTKFIASGLTGSSAMLSEGIHSLVDTGNGALMLLGVHLSKKGPDRHHPFGHGKELYFWTFIVAILIFAGGGAMSFYEGVQHILHPQPITDVWWNYSVLGIAFLFEAVPWFVAWKGFQAEARQRGIVRAIRTSKDPTMYTVLLEDSAALAGIVIAFAGILLGHRLGNPYFDGGASMAIGILLACVAGFLAFESKGLLIGEGVNAETLASIERLAKADPSVDIVKAPLTMYLSPHEVLLNLDVQFRRGLSAEEVTRAVDRLEKNIRTTHPDIARIYIEAESLTDRYLEQSPLQP